MLFMRIVTSPEGLGKALKDKVDEIWIKGSYAGEFIKAFNAFDILQKTSDKEHLATILSAGVTAGIMGLLMPITAIPAVGISVVTIAKMRKDRNPLGDYEVVEYKADSLLLKRKEKKKKEQK